MNNKQRLQILWTLAALVGLVLGGGGWTAVRADDGPVLIRTTLQIDMLRGSDYWAPGATKPPTTDISCWIPHVKFQVRKPIPSGARCLMAFTKPDGSAWVELPCRGEESSDDNTTFQYETPTGGDLDAFKKKYITTGGTFGFKITMHDELGGTDRTLMTGKFKLARVSRAQGTPETKNDADCSVDYDWALPIGYLWFHGGSAPTSPALRVSTWLRGRADMDQVSGYLFYQGKMVANTKSSGGMNYKVEHGTSDNRPTDPYWRLWDMGFDKVRKTVGEGNSIPDLFYLDKNPGDYEVKMLRKGDVVRDITFTVGPDGNVVDNGIATANHLGTGRILLPVKVLGTGDGTWKTTAWQTDAFFGNPLTGFSAP